MSHIVLGSKPKKQERHSFKLHTLIWNKFDGQKKKAGLNRFVNCSNKLTWCPQRLQSMLLVKRPWKGCWNFHGFGIGRRGAVKQKQMIAQVKSNWRAKGPWLIRCTYHDSCRSPFVLGLEESGLKHRMCELIWSLGNPKESCKGFFRVWNMQQLTSRDCISKMWGTLGRRSRSSSREDVRTWKSSCASWEIIQHSEQLSLV